MKIKKCRIERYDKTITKPPYLTLPLDEVEVTDPELKDGGVELAERLRGACRSKGYHFKFYGLSSEEGFDYKLVVQ